MAGDRNVIVQIQGDRNTVNVHGAAYLELTRYLARRERAPDANPLELLHPYAYAIPRVGRDPELAELYAWLDAPKPLSVRLVVGPGGAGKTRLALELCDAATARGWDAGLVTRTELERFWGAQNLATWGWQRPTLIVIDYAAAKADTLREWLAELARNRPGADAPLRVLLLDRHADGSQGWWHDVVGRGDADSDDVRALCDPVSPVALDRLMSPAERRTLFVAMLKLLGRDDLLAEVDEAKLDRKLADVTWGGEPLFVMMAAMTARDAGLATALGLSSSEAAFKIAEIELGRVRKFGHGRRSLERLLEHLAAYATLCQGLTADEARAVVETEARTLGLTGAGDAATVLETLGLALPDRSDGIAAVLPDVVGEALMIRALGGRKPATADACVLRALYAAEWRVVSSVIRAAQDHGAVDATAVRWLDAVGRAWSDDVDRLIAIVRLLPEQTTVLREVAADLTGRVVDVLASAVTDAPEGIFDRRAASLNDLAVRLGAVGRREAALAAIEEAVAIRRNLAGARPGAFRPVLASSLNNLSNRLSELGRREAALEAIDEAVSIRRHLAAAQPDAFRPVLANSLNNLSVHLSRLGRREAALSAIDEAVAIYRDLAAGRSDAFRPALALSLNNLSVRLSEVGRREAALGAIEEAVAIRRDLAAARPDAFRPVLASSLNNLSNRLSELGRREAALEAIEEAVWIRRHLAAAQPDAFRPVLAGSLNNLSNRLGELGRHGAALEAIEEALAIRRDLAAARPDTFRPDLAGSLNNVAAVRAALNQPGLAIAASEEAIITLRPHFVATPTAFANLMATMLGLYQRTLEGAGRQPDLELLTPILETFERLKSK